MKRILRSSKSNRRATGNNDDMEDPIIVYSVVEGVGEDVNPEDHTRKFAVAS